jgi:hypothetical protein
MQKVLSKFLFLLAISILMPRLAAQACPLDTAGPNGGPLVFVHDNVRLNAAGNQWMMNGIVIFKGAPMTPKFHGLFYGPGPSVIGVDGGFTWLGDEYQQDGCECGQHYAKNLTVWWIFYSVSGTYSLYADVQGVDLRVY